MLEAVLSCRTEVHNFKLYSDSKSKSDSNLFSKPLLYSHYKKNCCEISLIVPDSIPILYLDFPIFALMSRAVNSDSRVRDHFKGLVSPWVPVGPGKANPRFQFPSSSSKETPDFTCR